MAHSKVSEAERNKKIIIVAFLVIPVIHLLVFSYIPIITNVLWSFTNYKGVGTPKFIGLKNYQRIFTESQYIRTFKNCIWYMIVAIPQLVFAFALAVVVNGKFRGLNLFKSILIIPYLLNGVIVSTIFIIFFNNSGTLNSLLAGCTLSLESCMKRLLLTGRQNGRRLNIFQSLLLRTCCLSISCLASRDPYRFMRFLIS